MTQRLAVSSLGSGMIRSAVLAVALSGASTGALAVNGDWIGTTGNWSDAANWADGPDVDALGDIADGAGATADFIFNSATNTITLDSYRTLGVIEIGDSTSTFTAVTIAAAIDTQTTAPFTLTLNNNGSPAQINKRGGTTGTTDTIDLISAPLVLADNLVVTNFNTSDDVAAQRSITLSGVISQTGGAKSVTYRIDPSSLTTTDWLTLSGANTFSGGVIVESGEVRVGGAASGVTTSLGTGTVLLGATSGSANATLAQGRLGNNDNNTINNSITVQSGSSGTKMIDAPGSGANNFFAVTGALTLNDDVTLRRVSINRSLDFTTGNVSGSGDITKTGAGTVTLQGTSTGYTGSVTVSEGTLALTGTGSSQLNSGNSVAVNANAVFSFASGTSNVNPTIAGLNDGTSGGGSVRQGANAGTTRTLTLGGSGTYSFSGVIENHPVNAVTLALTKSGSGTQTLSGNNVYSGTTTVTGGVLIVNGTHTNAGAYAVSGTGTLRGDGSITTNNFDVVISSGGKLSPGNSPGDLDLNLGTGVLNISGAVSATNSQAMIFELALPGASDRVDVNSGSLNIGSGVLEWDDFVFTDAGGLSSGTYVLFDTGASITGTLGANLQGSLGGSLSGTLALSNDGQDVILTVVPEPATLSLLGLASLALRRRRTC